MSEWITQGEAAKMRRRTRQCIFKWIEHGYLRTEMHEGRRKVLKAEVLAHKPKKKRGKNKL